MDTEASGRGMGVASLRQALAFSLLLAASAHGAGEGPRYEVFIGGRQVSPEIVEGSINLKRGESHIFHGGMGRGTDDKGDDGAIATLVGRELLIRAAEERGIGVSDEEVREYAERRAMALGGREKFMKYLESAGVPWDVYTKIAGASLLASRYVEKTIAPGIEVSEAEVREYHRANRRLYEEPSLKTFDHLVVTMKGGEPSGEVESLFPPAGVPFTPSRTLQGYYRTLMERKPAGGADVVRMDGIKVRESSGSALWKQLDEVGPGEGILLKYLEKGRMVYQCVYVVGLEEGKKVSLQQATPSIGAKIRTLKKEKAILDVVEAMKKRYPVDIRRR